MYDTIIIGSGPAGLSAAVYAKRAQMNFIVIEKEYLGSGQISESGRIDNYLGLYGISGYDLGENFRKHAESVGVEFVTEEAVRINREDDSYSVILSDQRELKTRTVIYAAGARPRKLGIKGEDEFLGRGVSYCAVCDGAFYKGKVTAVIGGGDTALEDALLLSKVCSKVYLIHRRDEFRASRILQNAIADTENIEVVLNSYPIEISGGKGVESLNIVNEGAEKTLSVNGVFAAVGTVPNSGLLKSITELDDSGYVIADENGASSAKGIFAAGDVRTKQLRQVVTAVSDGANCVYSAEKYIRNLT